MTNDVWSILKSRTAEPKGPYVFPSPRHPREADRQRPTSTRRRSSPGKNRARVQTLRSQAHIRIARCHGGRGSADAFVATRTYERPNDYEIRPPG
jgi:hypothetical protein